MAKYKNLLRPRTTKVVHDAGFFRRMFAFLIDIIILDMVITAPFTSLFKNFVERAQHTNFMSMTYTTNEKIALAAVFIIAYLYFVLFEWKLGQTLGMMFMNISTEASFGVALIRNLFIFPVLPFVILWFTEPLSILFWRRTLTEHITKSRTLYVRQILL